MTRDELRKIAERIATEALEDLEFCVIYEDVELEDLDDDVQSEIHDLVRKAKVVIQ